MKEIGFYEHYIVDNLRQSINGVHYCDMEEESSKSDLEVKKKSFSRKQTYISKIVICLWILLTFGILVRFIVFYLSLFKESLHNNFFLNNHHRQRFTMAVF